MHRKRLVGVMALLSFALLATWFVTYPDSTTSQAEQRRLNSEAGGELAPLSPPGQVDPSTPAEPGVDPAARSYPPVSPKVVDLRQIEVVPYSASDPTNPREYLPPEPGFIPEREREELKLEALRLPPDPSIQERALAPAATNLVPGTTFVSIDASQSGAGTVSTPPDPELAVGPNHIIAVANVALAIYDKSGTAVYGPTPAGNLFATEPNCTSGLYDPNVMYDEEADRFIVAYDKGAFSTSGGFCLAASQTNDPTGSWNLYFFPFNNATAWLDYPHSGVGDEYIVMGGNFFNYAGSYVDSRIFAFDKADLYAGSPVTAVQNTTAGSTPQPLKLHGFSTGTWPNHGSSHYVLAGSGTLQLWNIAANTMSTVGTFNLGTNVATVDVPQLGGDAIEGNDTRNLDFEYRNGFGWVTRMVGCNPGAGTVNCVRWGQINLATAALGPAGTGTFGTNGEYRTFPDLAVNHCDDMAVGYSKFSTSTFPATYVTGRESGDAAGLLQTETLLKAGEASYTSFEATPPRRWGDYTGMTIDPDGVTFWYVGQYSKNITSITTRWGLYIGAYTFPSCSFSQSIQLTPQPAAREVCAGSSAAYDIDVLGLGGFSGAVTLTTGPLPPGAAAGFAPNNQNAPFTSSLTISGAPAGSYSIPITGTGGLISGGSQVDLTVLSGPPTAPSLLTPADGATAVSTLTTLSWSDVGAAAYNLEFAIDPDFFNVIYTATTATNSHAVTTPLPAGTIIYWRVQAQNSCGEAAWTSRTFTTADPSLVCGPAVAFEAGIPADWQVIDNTGGAGLVWGTTGTPSCSVGNLTSGSGVAACADSDVTGSGSPGYNTELVSNFFDLNGATAATLNAALYYADVGDTFSFTDDDQLNVDLWNGSAWVNLLSWNENHTPEDIALNLNSYAGQSGLQIRFRYSSAFGWDLYAQADDVGLACSCTPPPAVTGLAILPNGGSYLLLWDDMGPAVSRYELWSSVNDPFFTPAGSCTAAGNCQNVDGTIYETAAGLFDTANNVTFVVKAHNACGESSATITTMPVGEFEFDLVPGN